MLTALTGRSEKTLSPESHHPSPLSALPHYRTLYGMVNEMVSTLPSEMTLLRVIVDVRDRTWTGLKDVMSQWVASLLCLPR